MTMSAGSRRQLATSPFNRPAPEAPPVELYAVGDRVSHDQFGLGRVLAVEGDNAAVLVDFASRHGRIVNPFTKLTKL
ncbi:hypothetical protein [Streptomyces sp. NPDC005805]|uniref:hypothetical protein n=1 Tax=Streptomyces sp. NPDC005805 TaxID=3157068 RepID=UPI00037C6B9B